MKKLLLSQILALSLTGCGTKSVDEDTKKISCNPYGKTPQCHVLVGPIVAIKEKRFSQLIDYGTTMSMDQLPQGQSAGCYEQNKDGSYQSSDDCQSALFL